MTRFHLPKNLGDPTKLPVGGYTLRDGVNCEDYVSDHNNTTPDQLRTDLYVPIA